LWTCVDGPAYPDGVLRAAAVARLKSLYILGRDDAASREMAEAAQLQAARLGLRVAKLDIYPRSLSDFLPQIYEAMGADADAWIAFGDARDAAEMVKTFKRHGFAPGFFYARGAVDPRFIERVGQDAELTLASAEYDPRLPLPGNASFARAYRVKWSLPPGPLAAAAYAAGQVLAAAVVRAGSAEPEKLRATLATLEVDTVLGTYRVDRATGAQLGMQPTLVQIVRGRAEPVKDYVVKPYPQWSERVPLQ